MTELTPLEALSDYHDEQLSWSVRLPEYAPLERVGLNVPRIKQLSRLAGLQHLTVETVQGDRTVRHASISNLDSNGNARRGIMGISDVASVAEATVHNDPPVNTPYYSYSWGKGTISLNTVEISDRIIQDRNGDGSLRSADAWSHQLDSALKSGIRKTANQQLLQKVPRNEIVMGAGSILTCLLAEASNDENPVANIAVGGLAYHGMNMLLAYRQKKLKPGERRRSIFPSYQLDRLAAVHGLTHATHVIKRI